MKAQEREKVVQLLLLIISVFIGVSLWLICIPDPRSSRKSAASVLSLA